MSFRCYAPMLLKLRIPATLVNVTVWTPYLDTWVTWSEEERRITTITGPPEQHENTRSPSLYPDRRSHSRDTDKLMNSKTHVLIFPSMWVAGQVLEFDVVQLIHRFAGEMDCATIWELPKYKIINRVIIEVSIQFVMSLWMTMQLVATSIPLLEELPNFSSKWISTSLMTRLVSLYGTCGG